MTQVSVAESLDTGSAAGRLVITIMATVSQWERETIGERTSTHCATSAATASASGISSSVTGCLPTSGTWKACRIAGFRKRMGL